MVLDSSAIVAILLDEPERAIFEGAISRDPVRLIGAPTLLEAAMVLSAKKSPRAEKALDALLTVIEARVVDFGRDEARIARRAFYMFGKGRHPASLNFGDCMVYAIAIAHDEPLLFKGSDFSLTDVRIAG